MHFLYNVNKKLKKRMDRIREDSTYYIQRWGQEKDYIVEGKGAETGLRFFFKQNKFNKFINLSLYINPYIDQNNQKTLLLAQGRVLDLLWL